MAATTLAAEAFVLFFAGLVAKDLSSLSTGQALGISAALAVACLVAAGALRSVGGYVLGSVLQLWIIGFGFWVPMMFGIGGLFAVLWITSLVLGTRMERENAQRFGSQ